MISESNLEPYLTTANTKDVKTKCLCLEKEKENGV